jgi:hypothetical protein
MPKVLSSLTVAVGGDISGLAKTLGGKGVSTVKGFASSIGSMGGKLAALTGIGAIVTGGIAALGAAIGSAMEIKGQFEAIDQLAKLSDRMGIATESFVGLQHAADLSGVSSEELTGGLEKMLKTLGDASDPTSTAAESIRALGLDAAALAKQSPDEAFKSIAQNISEIQDPVQRAAAAMDIFGKAGQSLLPVLMTGKDGLNAATEEAAKLGLTFSRIDAAKVEGANDAISRLKATFVGLARTAAIAIAPVVQWGADKLTNFMVSALPIIKSVGSAIGGVFLGIYNTVAPIVERVETVVARTFEVMVPVVEGAASAVWGIVTGVWDSIYNFVAPIVTGIYNAVASRWEAIVASVTANVMATWNVVSAVWTILSDLAQTAWNAVAAVWEWGVELIAGRSADAAANTQSIFETIIDTFNSARDGITLALNATEYAITHWRDVFQLVADEYALAVVRTANQAAYTFTDVIPAYLAWFADNWQGIFTDLTTYTGTVMANLGYNVVQVFSNLPGLIAGTTSFDSIWTPLTEGFEATVKELPQLAERQKGEIETSLEDMVAGEEAAFGKGLSQHLQQRQDEARNAATGIIGNIKKIFDFSNTKPIIAPKIEPPKPLKATLDQTTLTVQIRPELASAMKAGSAEAQALRFAVRPQSTPKLDQSGPTIAPQKTPQIADAVKQGTDKQAELDRRQEDWLVKIEKNTRQPILQIASFA